MFGKNKTFLKLLLLFFLVIIFFWLFLIILWTVLVLNALCSLGQCTDEVSQFTLEFWGLSLYGMVYIENEVREEHYILFPSLDIGGGVG